MRGVFAIGRDPINRTGLQKRTQPNLASLSCFEHIAVNHLVQTFAHTSLSFSPDGRQLAVCVGFDFGYGNGRTRKSLEIRDVKTGRLTANLQEANFGWWRPSVAFLPDGRSVVVAGDDLLVWDVNTQKRQSVAGAAFDSIRCVASGREGNLFATGGRNVTIWDAAKRKPLRTIWGSRVAGPSWLLLPGFAGWLVGWMTLRSRKVS